MKERPILFSGPMVRAILEGRKTMTRRVMKPQPLFGEIRHDLLRGYEFVPEYCRICPFGQPGDRLRVKEAAWIWCDKKPNGRTKTGRPKFHYVPVGTHVVYCADAQKPTEKIDDNPRHCWRYKTGRFMPRWASRITLEIQDVRVERVQDITEEDAKAEGVIYSAHPASPYGNGYIPQFRFLWDSLNAKRGYGWDKNLWVWVVNFRKANQIP